jgi:uncharacterized protein (DUF433 family)
MTVAIQPEAPPLRTEPDGTIRVGTSRIPLERVIHAFQDEVTPKEFVEAYPTVTLADVYGVIAYYLRHQAEVDTYLVERERQAEEIRRQIEARQGDSSDIRQRLLDRRANRQP